MKRNELLAKSLTLGLAVATAATSMSVPGGLLAPQTVYAEEAGGAANAKTVSFGDNAAHEVGKSLTVTVTPDDEGSTYKYAWYTVEATETEAGKVSLDDQTAINGQTSASLALTKDYVGKKILVVVSDTTSTVDDGNESKEVGRALSDEITYAALPEGTVVMFGDKKMSECTDTEFNADVIVTAQTAESEGKDYIISDNADNMGNDTSYSFEKPESDGASTKTLFFKVSGDSEPETIYQQEITIDFDVTAPTLSNIEAPTGDKLTDTSATISVTSSEAGKAYYVVKEEGSGDLTGEQIKSDDNVQTVDNLTADAAQEISLTGLTASTPYRVYVVAEDAAGNLSDVKSVTFTTAASSSSEPSEPSETTVDLSKATIKLGDSEQSTTEFAYDGSPVDLKVTVTDGNSQTLDSSKYQIVYTGATADAPGTDTTAPTDAGFYKLWVIPAGGVEDCTGSKSIDFTITPVKVSSSDIGTYINYTDIESGELIYDGTDRAQAVKEKIAVQETYSSQIHADNITVSFQKSTTDPASAQAADENGFVGAGTYDVMVAISSTNYQTEGAVEIGTAVIDKYQPTAADITVEDQTVTYSGSAAAVTPTVSELLDASEVKVTYKQGGQEIPSPTNAGSYDVYVSYDGDDNCEALAASDTANATLTIEKATATVDHASFIIKPSAQDASLEYDLSASIDQWTLSGTDTDVVATVTVDESGTSYLSAEYDKDSKKVEFTLTEDGKALTDQVEFPVHVDFGDSFTNYQAAFDIVVTITDKSLVTVTVNNAEDLSYDGAAKDLTYTIQGEGEDSSFAQIDDATADTEGFTVTITKDGEPVSEIKDAGTYVVTAVYDGAVDDVKYYGKLNQEITVAPKTVSDLTDLISLDDVSAAYDLTDHAEAIKAAVKKTADDIQADDYEVRLDGDTVNAGTVDVYATIKAGNYRTDGEVKLGTATIDKGELTLTVTATDKGAVTIKAGEVEIPSDDTHVSLEYFKGEESLGKTAPTEAGKYTVKVIYTDEDNLTKPAEGTASFEISGTNSGNTEPDNSGSNNTGGNTSGGSSSGGSSSGGSSSGGSSSGSSSSGSSSTTTPSKDDTKKDDTSKTETKPDGTKVTTTETKAADGSVETKIELKNDATGVDATVSVAKDASGNVTGVTADVTQKAADNKTAISAAAVAQITEAAGTKDVAITTKTVDANGKTVREVTVNASDLTAGKKLKVVMVDPKTGEKTLVNKTTYKVAADGSLALDDLGSASYEVVTTSEANALSKEVLKTVKPEKSKKNVTAGNKTKFALDDALNMDNVAKITYKTSKKSVATVNSNGTITTKKAGKVTVKATVTLNNGKKKTIKMTVTVKPTKKSK